MFHNGRQRSSLLRPHSPLSLSLSLSSTQHLVTRITDAAIASAWLFLSPSRHSVTAGPLARRHGLLGRSAAATYVRQRLSHGPHGAAGKP